MAEQPKDLESTTAPTHREIIRLLQCRICCKIITEPVTLPCGHHCCRLCESPQPCPFCRESHDPSQSKPDQTLWMVQTCFEQEMERLRAASSDLSLHARVGVEDTAGLTTIHKSYRNGKLLATWDLVNEGSLGLDQDISYVEHSPSPRSWNSLQEQALQSAQEAAKKHMICRLCKRLLQDPCVATCRSTFCRACLVLAIKASSPCPYCATVLDEASPDNLVPNQALAAIVSTFYKDQQADHVRRQLLRFDHKWKKLPIVLWRETIAPNTAMQIDGFITEKTAYFQTVQKAVQRATQNRGLVGIILIIDKEHTKISSIGTLAHIRSAQWLGGDYCVVVDGISRFTYGDFNHASSGLLTAPTEPYIDLESEFVQVIPGHHSERTVTTFMLSPQALNYLERMSIQTQLRLARSFVSKMMENSEYLKGKSHLYLCGPCPTKDSDLPWWLAMFLPFEPADWNALLLARTPRGRLWFCCGWILCNRATLST